MGSFLKKYRKAPTEEIDYDIDFTDWLDARSDSVSSYEVNCDDGLSITGHVRSGGVIKVFVKGGLPGRAYRVRASVTTVGDGNGQRTKLGDIQIKVRGTGIAEGLPIGGGSPWDSANPYEPAYGGGTPFTP